MTPKCPRCFRLLTADLYAWECVGPCDVFADPQASAATGVATQGRLVRTEQRPPDTRRWSPSRNPPCAICAKPTREVCPYCHFALLPEWRESTTVSIALAGARATGKSIYLAILVKQLEQMVDHAGSSLKFGDENSRRVYENYYEKPLFETRGIMPPTVAAGTQGAYQRDPIILSLGVLRGGRTFLVIRDVAGEDLENPADDRTYLGYFGRADAVLFMFDPSAVTEVRELLKDYLPTQLNEVGNPDRVLENMLRLIGPSQVPIGMVLSKFDTMQALRDVQDAQWRRVMSNPGAAFTRDPGIFADGYDRADGDLLHQEVRSLLHLLHAQRFVNSLASPHDGAPRNYRFFTVSALGDAAQGDKLHPRGIAPFRCLDPMRWVLSNRGLI